MCPKVRPTDHRDRDGELIVDSGLNAKAAVVQTDVIENSRNGKNSQDSQVLTHRILTDAGEVAEWLKASVC
jgi:hypothetical protein